jgi:hypothetical protein
MGRTTNYLDAASRLRRDLALLPDGASAESVDHLAGLAGECVCKTLLLALGAKADAGGGLESKRLRVHLPFVLDELLAVTAGRAAASVYAQLPQPNPFATWSVEDRYVADGELKKEECEAHLEGLQQLFSALQAAALDGVLQ